MPNSVRILIAAKDEASAAFDRVQRKADTLSKTDFGKGIAQGLGQEAFRSIKNLAWDALEAVIDFGLGSIKAASDLNETMTKSEAVFGRNADAVEAWADTAADAFGQSKRQALDTASTFAGLFSTVGLAADQSAKYATKLTELGSDLASFFNTDVQTAIDSLRSGLAGEAEPLRKFNVFLSETAVTAKLTEMGVKKVGGAFTEAQKATARYQLILEQTQTAQGDFGRTSDGLANTQRTLQAQMEDLEASIGQELLPVMVDLGHAIRDDVIPALEDTVQFVKDNKDWFELLGRAIHAALPDGATSQRFDDLSDALAIAQARVKVLTDNIDSGFLPASKEMRGALARTADKGGDAARVMRDLGRKTGTTADDFKDLTKWAQNAGDALAEASYGPEELRLKFEGARIELRDNQDALEEVRKKIKKLGDDGKPVPRDLKKEFNDAKLAVNESKQEVIRLGTRLEVVGGISMSDLRSQFQRLGIRIDGATGKAADLWWYLNHIANVDLGTAYDNSAPQGGKHRAAGGPVAPYQSYSYQENGPEILSMGAMGGRVFPSTGGSGGGSGDMYVTLNLQAPAAATPGSMQAFAEYVGPAIAAYLQKRQLIAPARR